MKLNTLALWVKVTTVSSDLKDKKDYGFASYT